MSTPTKNGEVLKLEHRFKILGGLAAAAVIATMVATAGTAAAAPAASPTGSGAVVSGVAGLSPDVARMATGGGADATRQALAQYWTSERMTSAKPESEIPAVKKAAATARKSTFAGNASTPDGPAVSVGSVAPKVQPKATTISPMSFFPGFPVGHPTAATAGKVFFTSFGSNFVCSGTVVNSEGKSEVWTAGHCVSDGGAFNTNWVFVPNYVNGSAPFGVWSAAQLWTLTAWFNNNNDFANDVGAVVMNRLSGFRITDFLGGQGIAWNFPIGYFMYAFGYPQAAPFNGQNLVENSGGTADGGGGTIFMLNDMTGGSSGGAWLNFYNGNFGYINGHNDFKFNSLPQYMFSPYYGNQVAGLYGVVRGIST